MRSRIGVALVAGVMSLASTVPLTTVEGAQQQIVSQGADSGKATDFSARRRHYARFRDVDRSYAGFHYRPYLLRSCAYAQPYYFQSYPCYGPVPYAYGFRYGPLWW